MGWQMGNWKQSDEIFKTVLSRGPCYRAPYPIEWCGTCLWRVRASRCEEAGFPSHRVAPTRFSAGAQLSSRMRIRQAVVISLPHLPSNSSSRTTRILTATLVLCLHHSLGLYIAYSISSPTSLLLLASGPQSINHSINRTPTLCDATTQQRAATLQGSRYGSELHLGSGQLQALATTIRFFRYTTRSSRLNYSYNASQNKRDHHP